MMVLMRLSTVMTIKMMRVYSVKQAVSLVNSVLMMVFMRLSTVMTIKMTRVYSVIQAVSLMNRVFS